MILRRLRSRVPTTGPDLDRAIEAERVAHRQKALKENEREP